MKHGAIQIRTVQSSIRLLVECGYPKRAEWNLVVREFDEAFGVHPSSRHGRVPQMRSRDCGINSP
jgi:hypothetical protein